jgi:hypothetical protein
MHVQLDDRLYQKAKQRAAEAGFASVDEYVADVVGQDLIEEFDAKQPDLQHLFTPERIALIEAAAQEIKDGKCYTDEQVTEYFRQKRAAWDQQNDHR